ncbi:MAG: sensor histidine kinase, partial [Chloroflexota bacterium]|nr:sensor histidine kinase [Chloroflexota bacterium]
VRGELLQKLISMQEEERRRIAHELHDETSQALTSQLVKLEAIIAELPPESQSITSKLREIQGTITNMHDEIHRVIYELHPTPLDDLGLVAAIRWQSENQLSNAGVAFYFEAAGRERRLSRKVEAALFRITQEAITNVVRHACAESTAIILEFREDSVAVVIEDDGKGFDFQETPIRPSVRQGIGLLSMKERAEFLGGDFSIESGDSCGTLVKVEIPLIRDD